MNEIQKAGGEEETWKSELRWIGKRERRGNKGRGRKRWE